MRYLFLCGIFCFAQNMLAQQLLCEKVQANTCYAIPSEKGVTIDPVLGIKDWSNPEISIIFNIYISKQIPVILKMMCSNGNISSSELEISFCDVVKTISIPNTGSFEDFINFNIGTFEIPYPGFYTVRVKPIKKNKDSNFPGIYNLQICSASPDNIEFPKDVKRTAASVFLQYLVPTDKKIIASGVKFTVPVKSDNPGTEYVAVANKEMQIGCGKSDKGKYLFMRWLNTFNNSNPRHFTSDFSDFRFQAINNFQNEWKVAYNWQPESSIDFKIESINDSCDFSKQLICSYKDKKSKKWKVLGIFQLNKDFNYSHCFSYIINTEGENGYQERKAYFTNFWVQDDKGIIQFANQAKFGYELNKDSNRTDFGAGISNQSFWLSTGGFAHQKAQYGQLFSLLN